MQQKTIEYAHGKEKLIGELFFNEEISGKQPAVILFHAFEGRAPFALDYAKKLSAQGFVVWVADMYGEAKVAHSIDECFALVTPFLQDRQLVRTRALLAYETIRQQPQVDNSRISAIGFCFGGMCVLELARSGADLWAGISMHGVLAKSDLPTRAIKSKLLILHGYKDPQVPPVELGHFAEEMEAAGTKDWIFTFFGQARHSFTDPKTGTFDPEKEQAMGRQYHQLAAERSFKYAVDFLQEAL